MRYAVPTLAAILGLGAIASAVMSSVAASVLSAASMGVWNVIVPFRSKETSPKNLSNYMKISTIVIGVLATFLSLKVQSVYALWVLCSDFVYCFLFPALVCALFIERVKGSHVILGLIVAFVLRFGGGDASLGLPQILPYPTDANGLILVPYKSIAMVSSLLIMVLSSYWPTNKNTKTEPFKP
jgi:high affinity choline transporter 7